MKALIERYEPSLFSEHLAWSTHDAGFLNDLLPVPYAAEALHRVADHIDEIQEALGGRMLLENPSTYLAFDESAHSETDFIAEVVRRTGCGLLLDINNVHVASTNQQWDPFAYIGGYPLNHVREIHLQARPETLTKAHDRCSQILTTARSTTSSGGSTLTLSNGSAPRQR